MSRPTDSDRPRTGVAVEAYLDRIGAAHPARPDAEALRDLQLRHLRTVPFENLSVHLGEDILLTDDALIDKIVTRRRGGFCYELNGAFAALLAGLGYRVSRLAARAYGGDRFGPPFDHMALRVDLDSPWLADVGFGRFSHFPLRLDTPDEQADPGGVFRVVPAPDGDLDVLCDGRPEYRLETRVRTLDDFAPTCWYHRTSPDSHFTRSLVCSRLTEAGRVSLSGRTLIETVDGRRSERTLGSDREVLEAYRSLFGIELDRPPPEPG